MARHPEWAAYWQQLHAAQVRAKPRRLPVGWLHAAFLYAPTPKLAPLFPFVRKLARGRFR